MTSLKTFMKCLCRQHQFNLSSERDFQKDGDVLVDVHGAEFRARGQGEDVRRATVPDLDDGACYFHALRCELPLPFLHCDKGGGQR